MRVLISTISPLFGELTAGAHESTSMLSLLEKTGEDTNSKKEKIEREIPKAVLQPEHLGVSLIPA